MTTSVSERIKEYLALGGLFNPELMDHDKVRDLLMDCYHEIEGARNAALEEAAREADRDIDENGSVMIRPYHEIAHAIRALKTTKPASGKN